MHDVNNDVIPSQLKDLFIPVKNKATPPEKYVT